MAFDFNKLKNEPTNAIAPAGTNHTPSVIQLAPTVINTLVQAKLDAKNKTIQLAIKPKFQFNKSAAQDNNSLDQSINVIIDNATGLIDESVITVRDAHGNETEIKLNDEQLTAVRLIKSGQSFVYVGPAGTGKTTGSKAVIQAFIASGKAQPIVDSSHKHLRAGSLGILITSLTNKAVGNIRRQAPIDLQSNCITAHKALEYQPVYYEEWNEEKQQIVKRMKFEANRSVVNPLCHNIKLCIIEEASMVDMWLFEQLRDTLPPDCQYIFIGDINQIPSFTSDSVLGYKLTELPVVELKQVYRQALESPIIKLAHRILSGVPIMSSQDQHKEYEEKGKLQFVFFPKVVIAEDACNSAIKMLKAAYDNGSYNPMTDIILCPQHREKVNSFYKFSGTRINKELGYHISRLAGQDTHEIYAGFMPQYYAIGNRIVYDKLEGTIIKIEPNPNYMGTDYQVPSIDLNYWGANVERFGKDLHHTDFDLDALIEQAANSEDDVLTRQASHKITIILDENDGEETELTNSKQINSLDLAYSMTVHKAQGSEYNKVYLLFHNSHAVQMYRELLYTAVTRAKNQLIILCEKDSFFKGIIKQRIIGKTIAEKAEFFKKKKLDKQAKLNELNEMNEQD